MRAYRLGWLGGGAQAPQDAGVRASDAYVAAHDPLRGRLGDVADVALGVDPGRYFCGGLAAALGRRRARARVGFVHVPPDRALPRSQLLALTDEVVRGVLAALAAEAPLGRVLVTGFGPFPGVPDNPTAAYAAAAGGLTLMLDDEAGMGPVLAQLAAAGPADVIVALGVDSRQALPRPRFTIETQSWGWRGEPARRVGLEAFGAAVLRAGVFR